MRSSFLLLFLAFLVVSVSGYPVPSEIYEYDGIGEWVILAFLIITIPVVFYFSYIFYECCIGKRIGAKKHFW
ncbi:unnamed protein product [Caenorhabditis angaria]|uniref:Uncharacterized protein n=1 Tax=Caenorhabditis angaria TaxID=860376 RepID=A0A9P1N692_9PELO|nr:unnamed protein product [Caenorhabditis angaria]